MSQSIKICYNSIVRKGDIVKKQTVIDQLYDYIENTYGYNNPVFLKYLYDAFPHFKPGTIRESLRRLVEQEKLIKSKNGVYGLPDPNRVLKTPVLNSEDSINKKYIINDDGIIIGYRSGFYLANALRLTTQTPSIINIYSNEVAKKKRMIKIKNIRVIINKSRVTVSNENYKLLQVLDILNDFDKYSEYSLEESKNIFFEYLNDIELSKDEIEKIVSIYPKDAQIRFYKIGGTNAFTHK